MRLVLLLARLVLLLARLVLFLAAGCGYFLMINSLVLDLLDSSDINKLLKVLSSLSDVVPGVETSVLASWRVGKVIVQIGSRRLFSSDRLKILIAVCSLLATTRIR